MLGHEVDGVRRRHLRRDHKVALVLALFGIDQHNHAAVLHLLDDLFDSRQGRASFDNLHLRRALHYGRNSIRRAT